MKKEKIVTQCAAVDANEDELPHKVVKKEDAGEAIVSVHPSQATTVLDEEDSVVHLAHFLPPGEVVEVGGPVQQMPPQPPIFQVDGNPLPVPPFVAPPPHELPPAAVVHPPVALGPHLPNAVAIGNGIEQPLPHHLHHQHPHPVPHGAVGPPLPPHSRTRDCPGCNKVLTQQHIKKHQAQKVVELKVVKSFGDRGGRVLLFPNNARHTNAANAVGHLPRQCYMFITTPDQVIAGSPHLTTMGSSCNPRPQTADPFNIYDCFPHLVNFPRHFFQSMVNHNVVPQHRFANNHGQRGPSSTYNCFFRACCGKRDMTAGQLLLHLTSKDPHLRCPFLRRFAPWKEPHDDTVLIYRRVPTQAQAEVLRQELNLRVFHRRALGVVYFVIDVQQ